MTPSDAAGNLSNAVPERDFAHAARPLVRTAPSPQATPVREAGMQPQRTGRPRSHETAARTHDFLERVANGESTANALTASRMSEKRFIRLLDDNAFFAVYEAIRRGDLPVTAAVVYLNDDIQPAAA